jgi:predicted phosphodiesterase
MNKTCSIFVDNNLINNKVLSFLNKKYDSVFLIGNQMTSKNHKELPYLYYNYIRYNYDIDIVFQNLKDIAKFNMMDHKIGYIYNCENHNISYNTLSSFFKKINFIIVDDPKIPKKMFEDVFEYYNEVIYV